MKVGRTNSHRHTNTHTRSLAPLYIDIISIIIINIELGWLDMDGDLGVVENTENVDFMEINTHA